MLYFILKLSFVGVKKLPPENWHVYLKVDYVDYYRKILVGQDDGGSPENMNFRFAVPGRKSTSGT